ncbi:hypothetical protein ASG43_09220 [Aureimonas sp. Leaf454]|uniref:multiubiquitin domain-containing protein n=1 Tax=Aureimonas sp. Leaf454 TaxID=1736381 RepID=UPI0006F9EEF6|nr:multiubiquitin domain-containing protein [Aureimonas sp. Leaf454]KQT49001.1 hypothetical protein ASG43_09220 [Aureimonas sp. Leaf454]
MSADEKQAGPDAGREDYKVQIGDENLAFRQIGIDDAVVLGRQLIAAAGLRPVEEYVTFAVLPDGSLEEIRLDESYDLRGKGAEKVVVLRADATYRIFIDGREFSWRRLATGAVLKRLAGVDVGANDIFLEVRGKGDDVLVADGEIIDLSTNGVERFYTAAKVEQTFEIVVNSRLRIVPEAAVTFEQVVALGFPGHHDANVTFSMTYRHAASVPHSGELGAGGTVAVKNKGTVFNVTRTVQS